MHEGEALIDWLLGMDIDMAMDMDIEIETNMRKIVYASLTGVTCVVGVSCSYNHAAK